MSYVEGPRSRRVGDEMGERGKEGRERRIKSANKWHTQHLTKLEEKSRNGQDIVGSPVHCAYSFGGRVGGQKFNRSHKRGIKESSREELSRILQKQEKQAKGTDTDG